MKRRALLVGGAAGVALAAASGLAQRRYRIGVIAPFSTLGSPYRAALRAQLAKHGFVEGQNVTIDARHSEPGPQSALAVAAQLVASKPDAIMALTTQPASGAMAATTSIPIVFAWVGDPVRSQLVRDLARPGGNVTGVTNRFFELAAKRIELLRELLPAAKRVAVVSGYFDPILEMAMQSAQSAADRLGFELIRVSGGMHWERVIPAAAEARAQAAMVMTPFAVFGMTTSAALVVRGAMEQRLPAVYSDVESVELGGLLSYATSLSEDVRRAADLLARILKGEKPAVLPIDQAARFELGLNLKTARGLGLRIPPSILARADRVIE
jgi:putative ABC transport system substrate-binding protein